MSVPQMSSSSYIQAYRRRSRSGRAIPAAPGSGAAAQTVTVSAMGWFPDTAVVCWLITVISRQVIRQARGMADLAVRRRPLAGKPDRYT